MLDILYGNRIDEMRAYLEAGGNVDFSINGEQTPLSLAKTVKMAELLLEKGADIHHLGYKNRTPLLWQANRGNPPVVELLLRTDPSIIRDVDDYGNTALHLCVHYAYEQSLQCAEILVAADPTLVTVRDRQGQTPLDVARQSNNVATKRIIDLLRKAVPSRTIAKFVNERADVVRNMMWRPPNNKYSFGGPAYEKLKTTYRPNSTPAPPSTPIAERKSRKRTRKGKSHKSRKSRRC
jgi:ankyrin repeat protein